LSRKTTETFSSTASTSPRSPTSNYTARLTQSLLYIEKCFFSSTHSVRLFITKLLLSAFSAALQSSAAMANRIYTRSITLIHDIEDLPISSSSSSLVQLSLDHSSTHHEIWRNNESDDILHERHIKIPSYRNKSFSMMTGVLCVC
jgi:hypothetical protein